MKKTKTLLKTMPVVAAVLFVFCNDAHAPHGHNGFSHYNECHNMTFRDIPGVTPEEIAAIEALQKKVAARGTPLRYATFRSLEMFEKQDGTMGGFTVLMCEYLSDIIGIKIEPEIMALVPILENLENNTIDFATLSDSPERRELYFTAGPIAQRSFVMLRADGSEPLEKIRAQRSPRYVFMEGTAFTSMTIGTLTPGSYEAIFVPDEDAAYHALIDGRADVFVTTNNMVAAFDHLGGGVHAEDFLPLTFIPAIMVAQNPEYEAVMSVISKAMEHGAAAHLAELYRKGREDYTRHKFSLMLTDEEKIFLRENPVIPFASQNMTYPFTFYNTKENKWEGISFDILKEITGVAGIEFQMPNYPYEFFTTPACIKLVESKEVYFLPYLIVSDERKSRFLWSEKTYITDYYALLSKRSFRNVELNDIPFERVGIPLNTAFEEAFRQWFPNALYVREYPTTDDAIMALDRGEVDLAIASQSRLTALTNYYEFSDYKANFIFNYPFQARFAFNKELEIFRSIMDKALTLIDTDRVTEQWMTRTYDIEAMRLRSQRPWLVGIAVISLFGIFVLLLVLINNHKKRETISKLLEKTKQMSDYEIMKHVLATQALNFALWDMDITDVERENNNCVKLESVFIWSDEFRKMLGFKDEKEFPNTLRSWANQVHPDDYQKVMDAINAHLKDKTGKTPYNIEYRIKTKSGEYRYFHGVGTTLRDKEGNPLRFAGGFEDIHERKQMSETLSEQSVLLALAEKEREADERTKVMLDHAPFGINIFDWDFNVIDCNKTAMNMFGVANKDEYMQRFYEFNPEYQTDGVRTIDAIMEVRKEVLADKGAIRFEWIHKRPNGELFPCEVIFMSTEYKGISVTISYMRDMSNEKEAEALAQTILDTAPFGTNIWDKNYNISYVNNELVRIFGFESREEFADNFDKIFPEYQPNGMKSQEMALAALKKAFDEGYNRFEVLNINKQGEEVPNEITLVRIKLNDDDALIAFSRDLREEKQMLEKIESARNAAQAANLAKSTFLANMSHEIRTPMNSIIGFSELAADDDLPPKTKDYLGKITQSAELLLAIINDVLDISKIESGKMELERIPFELHEIFEYCKTMIHPKVEDKGITLQCYAEPSTGKKLLGDPVRLRQVLLNILSNAVKFTNEGTVKLMAKIKNLKDGKITVYFEVKDTGIGISREHIDNIFKPFAQADASITRKFGGTGLGLTITKNIIDMMGGTMTVASELGIGSKFSFEITFDTIDAEEAKDDAPVKKILPVTERPEFEGEILVCEDNAMNQQVISEHLSRVGLKTVIAENGEVGVNLVKERMHGNKKPFDLIFMDIHMPVMDGVEATKTLIELGCKTPIITLTANVMSGELERYKEIGMADSLGKPFTSQGLWNLLMKFLPTKNASANDNIFDEDEDLNRRLKAAFVESNKDVYENIISAIIDKDDIKLAHRLAHTLKSNAAQIGENNLRDAAAAIEASLTGGKNLLTDDKLNTLKRELKRVLIKLAGAGAGAGA